MKKETIAQNPNDGLSEAELRALRQKEKNRVRLHALLAGTGLIPGV